MTFFSGVAFILFWFVFSMYASIEAAALRSIVLRYAGVSIATRVSFFLLFIWRCRFFRVFFCTIAVFSLYREYVVRFSLPDGDLLLCDHELNF